MQHSAVTALDNIVHAAEEFVLTYDDTIMGVQLAMCLHANLDALENAIRTYRALTGRAAAVHHYHYDFPSVEPKR